MSVKIPKRATTRNDLPLEEREQLSDWEENKAQDLSDVRRMVTKHRAMSLLELANQKLKERREEDKCPVELQVVDIAHARSSEVLAFCLSHLGSGGTWSALRHKLGLGTSDIRWRLIRERAVEGLLPVDESAAIRAVGSQRTFLVQKLEEMLERLEGRMELFTIKQGVSSIDKDYWKVKTEIMKLLLEENSKNLTDHLEMKKAKAADRFNSGASIIVQNAYYIPRPGDSRDRIVDVVPLINELSEETRKIEALLADPTKLQTDEEST